MLSTNRPLGVSDLSVDLDQPCKIVRSFVQNENAVVKSSLAVTVSSLIEIQGEATGNKRRNFVSVTDLGHDVHMNMLDQKAVVLP